MQYQGKRVLVTDGDSRQILPIIRGLFKIGCEITTVCKSKLDNGYTSRYVTGRLLVSESNAEEYYAFILQELKTNRYDVLIALSDARMDLFTRHYDEIKQFVRFPFVSREVFLKAYDKQITMEQCMGIGIPCPRTKKRSETLDQALEYLRFPIIAKPRMACGSVGLKVINSREQLDNLIEEGTVEIDAYVFQEFIPQTGKQLNIHIVMDEDQNVASSVVTEKTRWYPVDGGASCLCRTIHNDKVLQDCVKLLQSIKWYSYCEIELIEDPRDGCFKILEINGRASASIRIMELAGVNVAEEMMQLAYHESLSRNNEYADDIRMRRLSTDILWFIHSPDRFHRKPSWFSLYKTHEVSFSVLDPIPFFSTGIKLALEMKDYKKEMQKRKRL